MFSLINIRLVLGDGRLSTLLKIFISVGAALPAIANFLAFFAQVDWRGIFQDIILLYRQYLYEDLISRWFPEIKIIWLDIAIMISVLAALGGIAATLSRHETRGFGTWVAQAFRVASKPADFVAGILPAWLGGIFYFIIAIPLFVVIFVGAYIFDFFYNIYLAFISPVITFASLIFRNLLGAMAARYRAFFAWMIGAAGAASLIMAGLIGINAAAYPVDARLCRAGQAAELAPLQTLARAWERSDIALYRSAWTADAEQYDESGSYRTINVLIRDERARQFNRPGGAGVRSVEVEAVDGGRLVSRWTDARVAYDLRLRMFREGRSEPVILRETYIVACDPERGEWLISANYENADQQLGWLF